MNERQIKPTAGTKLEPAAAREAAGSEDAPVKPPRTPTVADFIIDRDKADPLRRFRF